MDFTIRNEHQLSNNVKKIEEEIKNLGKTIGYSVIEIGRRFKHVKENNLAYGQFGAWVESIGFNKKEVYRFTKAYEQFKDIPSVHQISMSKIFEMLALPASIDRKEFLETKHKISSGKTKTVKEMTNQELRQLKSKLKNKNLNLNYSNQAFKKEGEYEAYICKLLSKKGISFERQVIIPYGLVDIVTKDTIYEVKLHLDRESVLKGIGQLIVYSESLPGRRLVLVGQRSDGVILEDIAYKYGIIFWVVD